MAESLQPTLVSALRGGTLVLDGGLSTELERRGHDISGRLWSARLLNDAPEAVVEVHSAFLRAGAQVITTASYQATPEGFARAGYEASAGEALLRRSVELARRAQETAPVGLRRQTDPVRTREEATAEAREKAGAVEAQEETAAVRTQEETAAVGRRRKTDPVQTREEATAEAREETAAIRTQKETAAVGRRRKTDPVQTRKETATVGASGRTILDDASWVAGSVGPYGALLANGSEYTGDYGSDVNLQRLRAFHRPRLEILSEAGIDVLAVETVPSTLETEALLIELAALGHPAWLSLTVTTDADGVVRTRRGELAADAFAMAADVDAIIAVGVNCTEPAKLATAIEVAAKASGKPVIAYPNSGEGWDAETRSWTGRSSPDSGFSESAVRDWLDAGAQMVGGCCRVGPDRIANLARQFNALPSLENR